MIRLTCILLVISLPTLVASSPLPCKDEIIERICVTTTTEYCDPVTAGFFAAKINRALEDAHPTIQQLACEVELYDISNDHENGWMDASQVIMGLSPDYFLERAKYEIIWTEAYVDLFDSEDARFRHEGYTRLSEVKRVLFHELAHFLEYRAVDVNAFNCTDYTIFTTSLAAITKCAQEESCFDQADVSSIEETLHDLRQTNHISLYSLRNSTEDFAEVLTHSLMLKYEPGRSYISQNGVVLFDFNEALASERLAEKLRIVETLLNFPFDDQDERDKLNYELVTCTGRFASQ